MADDAQLKSALLALITDKRKQVWAQVRSIESRFRDDISVEVSRRWQTWMGLPQESVIDLAAPFVFRQKDLKQGLAFSRHDVLRGFVRKERPLPTDTTEAARSISRRVRSASASSGNSGARSRSGTLMDGHQLEAAGQRIATNLRSLVSAPSAAAALSVLESTGAASRMAVEASVVGMKAGVGQVKARMEAVRGKMAEEMAHALDPLAGRGGAQDPRDYTARLASEYAEVLALGRGGRESEKKGARRKAGGSAAAAGGGADERCAVSTVSLQTAFGLSSVLPFVPVISSSVGSGMASIAGGKTSNSTALADGYSSYFGRVFTAPLQAEDGDTVLFAAPTPAKRRAADNEGGAPKAGGGAP
jgi:hypothetical protein